MSDVPEKIWIDLMTDEQPLYYTSNPHRLEMVKYVCEDTAEKYFLDKMNVGKIAERIRQIATKNIWAVTKECPEDDNLIKLKPETLMYISNMEKAIKADSEIKNP
jgi:hypothetical protein